MATITSAGIGSGLDVAGLVKQLVAAESQPLTVLDRKEALIQAKLSAYGSFKSALSSFQSAMSGLSNVSKFQAFKASSADASVVTSSSASNAVPGSYGVEVTQLAQANKLRSKTFADVTGAIGTGTLTFQFGKVNGASFTVNGEKSAQMVTISAAQNSVSGIRDAVNAANIGVTAAILNDGTGNRLVFTSKDSGENNSLKITVADTSDASNTDDTGLSQLAYDVAGTAGNGKNMVESIAGQNATLKVDGITISKATNSVTDVIQGVTLNLLKLSATGVTTTVTVARDVDAVKNSIGAFVKAYNDINKTVKDLTSYNAETRQGSILQGDASAVSVLAQIRKTLNSTLTGLGGTYTALSQVGIAFQKDGTLLLDSTKLQTAVDTNFNDIAGLFAAQGRPTDSLVSYASATDKTQAGNYAVAVSQLATQGVKSGAATAALADIAGTFTVPFVVDANNDTFAVKVDGTQSATVTLTQGSYATAAALTAEIQSKINGDATLKAASVSIVASFDSATDSLALTSSRYGIASIVEFTAVDTTTATTLGFSVGAGTTGVDVAGTINGANAIGGGRFLTGATGNAVEGLKLEIAGTATGGRGTVNYSQGYAWQLDKLAAKLLESTGPISSRATGLNTSIKEIEQRREVLNRRLDEIEKRYRAQFSALDSLLSKLRSTSDYLSQQLAALPGAARG